MIQILGALKTLAVGLKGPQGIDGAAAAAFDFKNAGKGVFIDSKQ